MHHTKIPGQNVVSEVDPIRRTGEAKSSESPHPPAYHTNTGPGKYLLTCDSAWETPWHHGTHRPRGQWGLWFDQYPLGLQMVSVTALMEPPMSGLMEPLTGADLGSRTG